MCGVSAIIINNHSSKKKHNYLNIISKMNNIVSYRGPDDEGYAIFRKNNEFPLLFAGKDTPRNVVNQEFKYSPKKFNNNQVYDCKIALGHRRLSIQDLSAAGHQPMCEDKQRYWIIFNGEIYNFKKLKEKMLSKGETFYSNTDTEVILKYYSAYGTDCFRNFHGMWSIIIYDNFKKELIACRDRFGIKPLYYYVSNLGNVYFASEIKQFTSIPEWKSKLNHNRAYDYIMYAQTDHTDETLFKNIYHCPQGHFIKIDVNNIQFDDEYKLKSTLWYKLKRKKILNEKYFSISKNLKQKISNSVKEHKTSDVPISYCLSGGIDSSILVLLDYNLIKKNNKNLNSLKTFSIFSEDKKIDEKKWIEEVIKNKKIFNKGVYPSLKDFLSELKHLTWVYDEPVCDNTIYSEWSVLKLISNQKIKVAILGQGADEIFGGYHNYFFSNLLYLFKKFNFVRLFKEIYYLHKLHNYSYFFIIKGVIGKILPNYFSKLYHFIYKSHHDELLKLHNIEITQSYNLDKNFVNEKYIGINNLNYKHIVSTSLPKLLRYADRSSMIHSVEVRVPYLSHEIVEYVLNLPSKYKIHNGLTKYILRDTFKDILPPKIKNRIDKIGFEIDTKHWLLKDASIFFKKKLNQAIKNSNGLLSNESKVYLNKMIDGQKPYDEIIFRLIYLAEWLKVFKVNI